MHFLTVDLKNFFFLETTTWRAWKHIFEICSFFCVMLSFFFRFFLSSYLLHASAEETPCSGYQSWSMHAGETYWLEYEQTTRGGKHDCSDAGPALRDIWLFLLQKPIELHSLTSFRKFSVHVGTEPRSPAIRVNRSCIYKAPLPRRVLEWFQEQPSVLRFALHCKFTAGWFRFSEKSKGLTALQCLSFKHWL